MVREICIKQDQVAESIKKQQLQQASHSICGQVFVVGNIHGYSGVFFCSQFCQPFDSPVTKCDKITPCKVGRDEFGFEFEREIIIIKIMRAFRN